MGNCPGRSFCHFAAAFPTDMNALTEFLWASIGLLLTIIGTLIEAAISNPPWQWGDRGFQIHALGVSYQIGAVLFVGCLGGKNAATLSQIAYVILGLTPWFPIFSEGGGLGYLRQPTFGYILGFIPGAWLCGYLAFQKPTRLEFLAFSCTSGLAIIHLFGLGYLVAMYAISREWLQAAATYSWHPLPGQFVIVCAVAVVAYMLRRVLCY